MENTIYGTIAANTSQGNLQHPPLTMRRFSANLSCFFDFAELQTHNKNRLAHHMNRTNFLKATKTEESVSIRKFDCRKTNTPPALDNTLKIMRRYTTHRASKRWLREAKKTRFWERREKVPTHRLFTGLFRCKIPHSHCFKRMKQLFQAYETTVSSVWNNCFKRMKQLVPSR